jgi:EAL and modified HD-GYP domain-containing signal transduction protein
MPAAGGSELPEVLVARQPIFDRQDKLVGYELLYRAASTDLSARGADHVTMSSTTLINGVLSIGFDRLIGRARAWVNIPPEFLLGQQWRVLDKSRCMIELLETVPATEATIAGCRALRDAGYEVALDDFVAGPEYEPIIKMAQVIKLDVLNQTPAMLHDVVVRLRTYRGLKLLAERIETRAELDAWRAAGFDYFQGYVFARPEIVADRDLPPRLIGIVTLMNQLSDADVSDRRLEEAFQADPALALRLLRIANSAAMGTSGVSSIRQAIQLVGRVMLHRWLALLLAASAPRATDVDAERLLSAVERARMCELLAHAAHRPGEASSQFLTGLLSALDALLGVSMEQLVSRVNVAPSVEEALLRREGPLADLVLLAEACQRADWDAARGQAESLRITEALASVTSESTDWARRTLLGS